MSIAEETVYTPEDLLTMPGGERFELVDGQLQGKEMGAESDWISMKINRLLGSYTDANDSGDVFGPETGYRCFPDAPNVVRKPDGSFIAKGRLPGEEIPKGHVDIAPDLAIEVISPNDLYHEVDAKVHLYQDAGIRLIWVINPENRTVKVYTPDHAAYRELSLNDELDGGEVLPGFRCAVREVFPA